jgi:hypothetical protein
LISTPPVLMVTEVTETLSEDVMVTVFPLRIVTVSAAPGVWPHDHVIALQLPLTPELHAAAYAGITGRIASTIITITLAAMNLAFMVWSVRFFMG